ncbi:hypothetical protein JQX13_50405 [Archangium violaceum]|uniref:hypothetical protein n=1 Tax=Archangium violaceum TaxID=83451 RepID=UPI00193B9402|nr:hypothetical protein [Archangium violaceum]QRK08080.1 hypothetical protein JQX13_50405 [Archangium violaceum]
MAGAGNGPGGLKVGDLYVSVTASIGEMVKTLGQVVDAVEEAADQIEENMSKAAAALGDFSEGLLSVAGLAAASVAVAGQTSYAASQEIEKLKDATMLLGREVGVVFLPLVREMTTLVKTAIATWRNLSETQKQNIVDMVKYSAIVGGVGLAMVRALIFTKSFFEGTVVLVRALRVLGTSMMATKAVTTLFTGSVEKAGWALVYLRQATVGQVFAQMTSGLTSFTATLKELPSATKGLGSSFTALLPKIGAVALPLLAVAAAVGAIVLFAGSLYKSWDNIVFLWKESTADIVDKMKDLGEKAADFFGKLMGSVTDFISKLATAMLNAVFDRVKAVAKYLEAVAWRLQAETLAKNLAQVQNLSAEAFMKRLEEGVAAIGGVISDTATAAGKALSESTKTARENVTYGLKHSLEGAEMLGRELVKALHLEELLALKDKLLGAVPEVGDPNSVTVPTEMETETVGEVESDYLKRLVQRSNDIMDAYLSMFAKQALSAAGLVTGALVEAALEVKKKSDEITQAMRDARDSLKSKLVSRIGDIADILNSFAQGVAAGGIWGGVIAVLADILTRSEGFRTLVEMINTLIQLVADSLGQLLGPLQPLVGAIGYLVQSIMGALTPILQYLLEAVDPLIPVLVGLGEVFAALQPVFQMLAGVLQLTEVPLRLLAEVALRLFFELVRGLAIGILEIAKGIAGVWNGIIKAVQRVFRALGDIEVAGIKPFDFMNDWARSLNDAKISTTGLNDSLSKLKDMTWDAARAKADETAEVLKNRAALEKANESLSNVPTTWKVTLARFNAQRERDGQTSRGPLPVDTYVTPTQPASSPSASPAAGSSPASSAPLVGVVNIATRDLFSGLQDLQTKLGDIAYRHRGSVSGILGAARRMGGD